MSDTPRTDAAVLTDKQLVFDLASSNVDVVYADFARQLERELAKANALAERSTRRLVELSAPGSIGAFSSRDHWQERAEKAEAENADIRAAVEGSRALIKALQDENAALRAALEAAEWAWNHDADGPLAIHHLKEFWGVEDVPTVSRMADEASTMAYFDLSDKEWDATPVRVQAKLRTYVRHA